jgi:ATP-dependent DNA ligase
VNSPFSDRFAAWGPARLAPIGSLSDLRLKAKLERYKRTVAKRYRVIFPDRLDQLLPAGPLHISTKVDGELWFLVKLGGAVALCAYNGRVIEGAPVTDEAATQLAGLSDGVFPGELFALLNPKGGSRPRVHDVARALKDDAAVPKVAFKPFDVLEIDGTDWQGRTYADRWTRLSELFGEGRRCAPVTTVVGEADEAARRYADWVASGRFEGMVVRSAQGLTFKVKPELDLDAVVIGFGERDALTGPEVRELHLALVRDDGSYHVLGPVGGGFSESDRVAWHQRLAPLEAPSSYRMANREGTLARFVRPEIVAQIKVSDLLASDVVDNPSTQMTLSWSPSEGWSPLQVLPLPSLIHPVFVRERSDKAPDAANCGLTQIWSYLPFEGVETRPVRPSRPPGEVVYRRVWTKTTKDKVAVRKAVVIATHKSELDNAWPPFVAFFTDFAAGRKEPLQTSLRVAATEAKALAAVDAWIGDNVKRGWSEVEAPAS